MLQLLPALCVLVSPAIGADDEVDRVRDSHAAALLELSDACVADDLLNDAERLLLEALTWSEVADESTRRDRLRARRVSKVRDPERDPYRAFLRSKDFARRVDELSEDEEELREKTFDALVELARTSLRGEDTELAERALAYAIDLDADDKELKRVAGAERLERLLARRAEARGLGRMTLGETIFGPEVTLDDLEGKVVLWRSSSL